MAQLGSGCLLLLAKMCWDGCRCPKVLDLLLLLALLGVGAGRGGEVGADGLDGGQVRLKQGA